MKTSTGSLTMTFLVATLFTSFSAQAADKEPTLPKDVAVTVALRRDSIVLGLLAGIEKKFTQKNDRGEVTREMKCSWLENSIKVTAEEEGYAEFTAKPNCVGMNHSAREPMTVITSITGTADFGKDPNDPWISVADISMSEEIAN